VQEESRLLIRQQRQWLPQWVIAVILIGFFTLVPAASQKAEDEAAHLPAALQNKAQNYSAASSEALKDLQRGVNYFTKEQYASALEALPDEKESSLTAVGDYILLYRAKSYLMLDQGKEALSSFRLLRSQYPESPLSRDALIGESLSLLKVKEPNAALSLLRSPELELNSEILFYQARALEEAGEKQQAIELYLKVYSRHPGSSFSPQAMRNLLSLSPGALLGRRNYEVRLQRAENLVKAGNATDARILLLALGRVAAPDPKSSEKRLLLLGEVEYRRNKTSVALGYLRKVSASYPELHSKAVFLEGACYRRLDKESAFLELREKALKLYPKSSDTEELCYSAATYYDVNYSSSKAWNAYKVLYENFPKGRYAERALWKLALFPYFEGKYGDAAHVFWNYLIAYPNPLAASSAMYWMGRCYQKLGDLEHAKYLYSQTIHLANDSYYGRLALEAEASLKKMDVSGNIADIALDFDQVIQACEKIRFSPLTIEDPDEKRLGSLRGFGNYKRRGCRILLSPSYDGEIAAIPKMKKLSPI
jgi:TolA-binding protein